MQLQLYISILRRLWPLVVLLPLLAGGLSLGLALARPPVYQSTARLLITLAPQTTTPSALPDLDDNATWATTEYILDDLPLVLASSTFADDVAATLTAEGYQIPPTAIQTSLRPEVTHRVVALTATAGAPEQAQAVLRGAIAALQSGGLKYWGRAPSGGLQVAVIDPPGTAAPARDLSDLVRDVGLRTALALAAAVGLAFLIHALDDRLRTPHQAEQWTGARVLGIIPKE